MNATSIKARLKMYADASGKTMQEILTTYGFERTIYRLSISEYRDQFALKGGMFLYVLFDGEYARTTRDIDLLAENISNNANDIMEVFKNIFSIECDDALRFDIRTLEVKDIVEFKEYHGVNVKIVAYLDRTRIPVSIDVGFGDIISPRRIKMKFPVLLKMTAPEIYTYSIYSVIAEKFEAIVSLGNATSRYKDFYDIYILADRNRLNGEHLRDAVKETFKRRKTDFKDIVAFGNEFKESPIHQKRWVSFTKKKKAMINLEFSEMLIQLRKLLKPIVDSISNEREFHLTWNNKKHCWE